MASCHWCNNGSSSVNYYITILMSDDLTDKTTNAYKYINSYYDIPADTKSVTPITCALK